MCMRCALRIEHNLFSMFFRDLAELRRVITVPAFGHAQVFADKTDPEIAIRVECAKF